MTLFLPDGGRRPVPGVDPDIVAEYKQLLLDTLLDGLKAAPREVCPADGTCKQGIADKDIIFGIKGNPALGVSRRMNDCQSYAAEGNLIAALQFPVRGR